MLKDETSVKRVTNFLKEDKSRYAIVVTIVISILLLGITIYNSVNNNGKQWIIWISFISAVFGMMNVTTYSIMDLEDPVKRNKYRIFIVFNTIAVITLATVNLYSSLWILAVENFLFFFSGCYQFYNWFLKESKKPQKEKETSFAFKRFNSEDGFIVVAACLLAGLFISIIAHSWLSNPLYKNYFGYLVTRTILDSILGVAGMLGAFMVGRKRFFSIIVYIFSNSALITLWTVLLVLSIVGSDDFTSKANINPAQCINMIGLFVFYNSVNFLLIKKWGANLEPKKKKNI